MSTRIEGEEVKIEEMLSKFKNELMKEYGCEGLVKIALEPDLFEQVCAEFYCRRDFKNHIVNHFRLSDRGEFFIEGIQIVARPQKEF